MNIASAFYAMIFNQNWHQPSQNNQAFQKASPNILNCSVPSLLNLKSKPTLNLKSKPKRFKLFNSISININQF
jgi:hypothetical protein